MFDAPHDNGAEEMGRREIVVRRADIGEQEAIGDALVKHQFTRRKGIFHEGQLGLAGAGPVHGGQIDGHLGDEFVMGGGQFGRAAYARRDGQRRGRGQEHATRPARRAPPSAAGTFPIDTPSGSHRTVYIR